MKLAILGGSDGRLMRRLHWVLPALGGVVALPAVVAALIGNIAGVLVRSQSDGYRTAAVSLLKTAVAIRPASHALQHDLARALNELGRKEEAEHIYETMSGPSQVSFLEQARLLGTMNRPTEALEAYKASSLLDVILDDRRQNLMAEAPLGLRAEASEALLAAAQSACHRNDVSECDGLAREAFDLTPTRRVRSAAADVASSAREAMGDLSSALGWLAGVAPVDADSPDRARSDRLAGLWLKWLSSGVGAKHPRARLYRLRCLQWLGDDRQVLNEATSYLSEAGHREDARQAARCLLLESQQRLGRPPAEEQVLGCGLPFQGPIQAHLGREVADNLFSFGVDRVRAGGTRLARVVVNTLDLDLGLPVSTDYYFVEDDTARRADASSAVVYARPVPRLPNGGFELDALLGREVSGQLPSGYERTTEIGAEPGVFVTPSASGSSALRLSTPGTHPGASAGILSFELEGHPGERLVQGAAIRSAGGDPFFGRVTTTRDGLGVFQYVEGIVGDAWTTSGEVFRLSASVREPRAVLVDFRGRGQVWFDNVVLIPLPPNPPGH